MKTIYLCGPTLYSNIHIGNARSIVFFDVVAEYFRRHGGVKYVRNVTDIDDKIIAVCGDQDPGQWVRDNTLPQYQSDLRFLGTKPPDAELFASDYINQVHITAQQIGECGSDGDIVLDTSKLSFYGEVSNRTTNSKFALWKGRGQPGWHGECQSMIQSEFGDRGVDIHGGGVDLIFPHHENENAIHKCATGNPIAREWIHVGTLKFGGKKMAKSQGNFETIQSLSDDWNTGTIRTALLMSKFSKPIDWNFARLKLAEKITTPENSWDTSVEWSERQINTFAKGYMTIIS